MKEAFLHFIWQYQYFQKGELLTALGNELNVIHPGFYNNDAGPDFKEAKILIDGIEWRGHVEIHVKSSDWNQHLHQFDKSYNSVVLHVVWQNDKPILREDGSEIPTLSLSGKIDERLIFNYQELVNKKVAIPCSGLFERVKPLVWLSLLDKMLLERLHIKASLVLKLLANNTNNWQETAHQLLAKNFGFKINAESFFQLSQFLPQKLIQKHINNEVQLQALVFGVAGFLDNDDQGEYRALLRNEYQFLSHKYGLVSMDEHQWLFLRLRPANFPTVRLAQWLTVLKHNYSIFDMLINLKSLKDLVTKVRMELPTYWQHHYMFGRESDKKLPMLGKSSIENLLINTAVPLQVAYGKYTGDDSYIDNAISLLEATSAENNKIVKLWKTQGREVKSAFDSQAYIQLYNNYCMEKRCLSCNVGISLIRNS